MQNDNDARSSGASTKRYVLVVFLTITSIFLALCGIWAIEDAQTNVLQWADERAAVTKQFRRFTRLFNTPDFAVVSWPTETWDDPTFVRTADQLRQGPGKTYFRSVSDSVTAASELEQSSEQISLGSAVRRLEGALVGKEQQHGCLVALFNEHGRECRENAVRAIQAAAASQGIDADALRLGGIATELAWLERDGIHAPLRLSPLAGIVCWVVSCVCLRSLKIGTALTVVSGFSGMSVLGLMIVFGIPLDAVNATLPVLGLMLASSLGLHWLGYFSRENDSSTESATIRATQLSLKPGILSIATTGLGLLSLLTSNTSAIRTYGILGATTVALSGFWIFVVFPQVIRALSIKPNAETDRSQRAWIRHSLLISRLRVSCLVVLVIGMVATSLGLPQLQTSVRLDSLFRSDHQAVRDARWLEKNVGNLASMELMVTVPHGKEGANSSRSLAGIEMMRDLEAMIRKIPDVDSTFSAYHLVPPIPSGRSLRSTARRRGYAEKLESQLDELTEFGFFQRTDNLDIWRLSAYVTTFQRKQQSRADLASKILDQYRKFAKSNDLSNQAIVTGIPLLVEEIEQQFFRDLIVTYVVAVLLIFLAVWLGFQSLPVALLSMIPNMFPPLVILGIVGWLNISLDVGSVMTASIALGIAVDDTIHLLVSTKRELEQGHTVSASMRRAMVHSGPAVLRTSILGATALCVLAASSFLPTARFGVLMASMLVAAIIGDLVMLPALISTKLGNRIFLKCFGDLKVKAKPTNQSGLLVEDLPAPSARCSLVETKPHDCSPRDSIAGLMNS